MANIRQLTSNDAETLFRYLSNPHVARFSRLKPNTKKEMINMIEYLLIEENEKRVIPRVIVDLENQPVGMIILWDYCPFRREGFMATWLGEEHWGKGYNQIAKDMFFDELFTLHYLNHVCLLIREYNERSLAASRKFPYITMLSVEDEMNMRNFYEDKISEDHVILVITKDNYQSYVLDAEQTC